MDLPDLALFNVFLSLPYREKIRFLSTNKKMKREIQNILELRGKTLEKFLQKEKEKVSQKLSKVLNNPRFDETDAMALIKEGADVNAQNNNGQTFLMLTQRYQNRLLELGADPLLKDKLGMSFLGYLVQTDNVELVKKILRNVSDERELDRLLISAVMGNTNYESLKKIVNTLLKKNANPNAENEYGETVLELLVSNFEMNEEKYEEDFENFEYIFSKLLEEGAEPTQKIYEYLSPEFQETLVNKTRGKDYFTVKGIRALPKYSMNRLKKLFFA